MTSSVGAAVPELDELTVTIVADNATDPLSTVTSGIPQHSELVSLLGSPHRAASTTGMTAVGGGLSLPAATSRVRPATRPAWPDTTAGAASR